LQNFYKNKKILITGSSGFVGSWLSTALFEMGASLYGISLKPNTSPSLFKLLNLENKINQKYIDICEFNKLDSAIKEISPDIVFHLAAQPLVRESYERTIETFNTNVIGTLNVLEACKNLGTNVNFVCITTDKCYENNELGQRFVESDPMGGKDPYSASKACTEIVTKSHALSFNSLKLCTARAGNIIGGGDWAKDRIVTDIVESIEQKKDIVLRSPNAIRPWQHVIDVVNGYLKLAIYNADKKDIFDSFNFGPQKENEIDVETLTNKFISNWNSCDSSIVIDNNENLPESKILRLDSSKAHHILDWEPLMDIDTTIKETAVWYENFFLNKDIYEFTIEQINKYL
jgi:CDP-glucose 4,6-dehydratase|tara:strand:- start:831 stop:1865 length:1035 start_codon:yes stop_codon:yes gene_type:complete